MIEVLVHPKEVAHPVVLDPYDPSASGVVSRFGSPHSALAAHDFINMVDEFNRSYHSERATARVCLTDRPPAIPIEVPPDEMPNKVFSDVGECQAFGFPWRNATRNKSLCNKAGKDFQMSSVPSFPRLFVNVLVEGDGMVGFHSRPNLFQVPTVLPVQTQPEPSCFVVVVDAPVGGNEPKPIGLILGIDAIKEVLIDGMSSAMSCLKDALCFEDLLDLVVMEVKTSCYLAGWTSISKHPYDRLEGLVWNGTLILGYQGRSPQTTLDRIAAQPHLDGQPSYRLSRIESTDDFFRHLLGQFGWHISSFDAVNQKPFSGCWMFQP